MIFLLPGIPTSDVAANLIIQNASGEIRTVQQQTGIYAGTGGFNINVGGNTALTGAVLASEAAAALNQLTTGSLTLADLINTSEWGAETTGFSGSISKPVACVSSEGKAVPAEGKSQATASPNLGQSDGESDQCTTRSAIAMGTITVKDGSDTSAINRDTANANNGVMATDVPDLQAILAQQADRAAVAKEASAAVAKTVGDLADHFASEAIARNDLEAAANWAEAGEYRVALHGLTQGLTAGLGGGDPLGAGLGAAISNYLPSHLRTGSEVGDQLLGNLISGGLGYAVGGTSGAFSARSVDANNRQLHPAEYMYIRGVAGEYAREHGITYEEAVQLLVRGALYLNDEKWREQYDQYYSSEVASYKEAGEFVKSTAAAGGFNLSFDGLTQAAFTSTTAQFQNTKLGVQELSRATLMDDMLLYATVRNADGFSVIEYQAAMAAGNLAGQPVGVVQGTWGLIEGAVQGIWDLSGYAPTGPKGFYETISYGPEEAARLNAERWSSLGNTLANPYASVERSGRWNLQRRRSLQ